MKRGVTLRSRHVHGLGRWRRSESIGWTPRSFESVRREIDGTGSFALHTLSDGYPLPLRNSRAGRATPRRC